MRTAIDAVPQRPDHVHLMAHAVPRQVVEKRAELTHTHHQHILHGELTHARLPKAPAKRTEQEAGNSTMKGIGQ